MKILVHCEKIFFQHNQARVLMAQAWFKGAIQLLSAIPEESFRGRGCVWVFEPWAENVARVSERIFSGLILAYLPGEAAFLGGD